MTTLHSQIKDLIDKRARAWEQAKPLNDAIHAEGRDFSAEEQEQWDRYNADIDQCDARIAELDTILERERDAAEARLRLVELVGNPDEQPAEQQPEGRQHQDPVDMLRIGRGEQKRSFDVAVTSADKAQARDLVKGTASAGGNTVPTSFVPKLYEHMIETAAIRQTNVTVLTTATGEALQIPKTTAHGTAALVAEGAAIPENDPTFGQVTLDAYKYGVMIQVSHELMNDTAVDLSGYIARQAGRALGNVSGADFITGNGTNKPNGVVTAATLGKTAASATAITTDELIDLYFSVIEPYRRNSYWMFRDSTLGAIRKLKDTTNQYLWNPGLSTLAPSTILDKPYVVDPNVAAIATTAKTVLFGDFSTYYIRDIETLRFEVSTEYAFNTDLVSIRVLIRTDGDLVDTTGSIKFLAQA